MVKSGLYPDAGNGSGYNLIFHGTNQVQFLDDGNAWGNTYSFNWQVGTSYWFQLAEITGLSKGRCGRQALPSPRHGCSAGGMDGSHEQRPIAQRWLGILPDSFSNVSVTTTSIQPDTAAAGSALTANAGSAVSFNQATATGTGPLKYAWSFGDGTTATGTLNATHTYATAGTYSAQLTVTDALGIPITSTVSVAVNGTGTSAPIVSAGSPITDNADTSVTFSQATETGGTAPFAYSWNFGDGTTATGSLNPSHTYMNPGSYTATVTVTDANKLTSSSSLAVTVKDVAPSVTIADPTGTVGTPVSFSATATSLSPAVETAGFTYAWTFGDGGTSTGATPTHTYTTAGTYTATVTAKDEYGMTGTASETITIVSAALLTVAQNHRPLAPRTWQCLQASPPTSLKPCRPARSASH